MTSPLPPDAIVVTVPAVPAVEIAMTAGPPGPPGEGVPAGGTTGQVLAKASNSDYDTEWVSSFWLEPVRPGRWRVPRNRMSVTTAQILSTLERAALCVIPRGTRLDRVAIYVSTGQANTEVRMAARAYDPETGMPGEVLEYFGKVDSTSNGAKTLTIDWTTPSDSDLFYFSVAKEGAGTEPTLLMSASFMPDVSSAAVALVNSGPVFQSISPTGAISGGWTEGTVTSSSAGPHVAFRGYVEE